MLPMKLLYRLLQCPRWIKDATKNATAVTLLLLFSSGTSIGQEFTLDWQNDEAAKAGISRVNAGGFSEVSYMVCNVPGMSDQNCSGGFSFLNASHDDGTAFFQEELLDSADGQRYFHVIVGDFAADEMALEYFIKANSGSNTWASGWSGSGNIGASHSLGQAGNGAAAVDKPYSADSTLTGTGSGNPESIIMRQLVTDSTDPAFSMDFVKDRFLYKPKLIHTNGGAGGFIASTVIDMSNKLYSDITPIDESADFDNFMVLTDPLKNGTEGDYNVDTMGDIREFRAGGYTYTPGTGTGGAGGTYSYIDPTEDANPAYDPLNADWVSFCDISQNVDWSGNGACTNGDGTGGGWGGGGGGWGGWR